MLEVSNSEWLFEPNAFHILLIAPLAGQIEESHRSRSIESIKQARSVARPSLAIVVTRRAFGAESNVGKGIIGDRLDPVLFGLLCRLDAACLLQLRARNHVGHITGLLVQHMGKVRRQGVLRNP